MRAILVPKPGDIEVLTFGEYPIPEPKESEVRIRVRAIGINRADIAQRKGKYAPVPGASPLLGLEVAGEIESLGNSVKGFRVGDRVCTLLPGGGYAEYAVTPADLLIPIPDSISFEEAAAIPEAFITAYQCLFWIGRLQKGETVCIHAGASGVGTAAIQLSKQKGARVIATVGSEEKKAVCEKLGADYVILYKQQDFAAKILEYTNQRGVELLLDFVGASYWEKNIQSLALDGRMVLISFLGGAKLSAVSLSPILLKRLQITGTTLKSRDLAYKSKLVDEFRQVVMPFFYSGKLKPVIHRVYHWHEVKEAHREMEENKNIGKIILSLSHHESSSF